MVSSLKVHPDVIVTALNGRWAKPFIFSISY